MKTPFSIPWEGERDWIPHGGVHSVNVKLRRQAHGTMEQAHTSASDSLASNLPTYYLGEPC